MNRIFKAIFDFLASVKLAVFVILALAIVSATGTIVESRYDALTAKKLVYESWWMLGVLGLLVINLVFAAVDRLPWKRRHIGFLLAHIGIITLIFGSMITQKQGIDGTLIFGIGERSRFVSTTPVDLAIYMSFDGDRFTTLHQQEVDFFREPLSSHPIQIPIGAGSELKVLDFVPYAKRDAHVVSSTEKRRGPAVQFRLYNGRADVSDWAVQEGQLPGLFDLGPAQVTVAREAGTPSGKNEIMVFPVKDKIGYKLFKKGDPHPLMQGQVTKGQEVKTPWMGLIFKVQNFWEHADWDIRYMPQERPTPATTSAIKISFNGTERWVGLNSILKLFTDEAAYVISYGSRRLDLGFDLKLKEFKVGRYPGTNTAASYQSVVEVPEVGDVTIAMNEPLKYKGYTFYQASFQENEMGEPTASVLSVNRDPGRMIKYIGSLIIVLGIICLFYFKRLERKAREKGTVKS